MVKILGFFSKETIVYLAATFALTTAGILIIALLSGPASYALPVTFEFHSSHRYAVDDIRIDELQHRIEALAGKEPRILLARLSELTQIPDGCDGPTLDFKVSVRAMVYSGSETYYDFVDDAEEVELGKRCGRNSMSLTPGRHIVYVKGILAFFVLMLIWRSRRGRSTFGVNWSDWTPRIGWVAALRWGTLGGAAAIILVVATTLLLSLVGAESDVASYLGDINHEQLLALLPLAIIAAPVFEEFLFRAWMMERLTRVLPTALALLMSTLSFAAIHFPQSVVEVAQLFLAGLILGAIWWRFRSLTACVVTHAVYNSFAFATYWFQIDR